MLSDLAHTFKIQTPNTRRALNGRTWNLYNVTSSESDLFAQFYDVHQLKRSPNDCIKRIQPLPNVCYQEVHRRIGWLGGKRLFIEKLQWKSVVDCNLLKVFPCRKETQTLQEMALYFEEFRKYPEWKLHKCHFSVLQQPEVSSTIFDIGAYMLTLCPVQITFVRLQRFFDILLCFVVHR